MTKLRIAVATKGQEGLKDTISEVFGRASNFTVVSIEKDAIENVKVHENPAISYQHGAGPIVVKMLVDLDVNLVIAPEFGPGASTLLEQHNIEKIYMKAGTVVSEAVRKTLGQQKHN